MPVSPLGPRARLGLPPHEVRALPRPPTGLRGSGEESTMEFVIAAVVLALGLVGAAFLLRRRPATAGGAERARATAAALERPAPRGDEEAALARRAEMGRLEERLLG